MFRAGVGCLFVDGMVRLGERIVMELGKLITFGKCLVFDKW